MAFLATLLFAASGWQLTLVERRCAHTMIRLWGELHDCMKLKYDFADMMAPPYRRNRDELFVGASKHGEIRALALCRRSDDNQLSIMRIAHAPDQMDAPVQIIHGLRDSGADLSSLQSQNRWFLESLLSMEDFSTEDA